MKRMIDYMNCEHEIDQLHFVKLRQWSLGKEDTDAFRQLMLRGDHRYTDEFLPECYSEGCEFRWIKGMVDNLLWGDELHYAIDVDGKAAGCLNVSRCGGVYSRTGILRLILLPEYCGRGIGTEAVGMAVQKALHCYSDGEIVYKGSFESLEARVIGNNPAAVRVLEKNGFAYEGTVRNTARKGFEVFDEKVYGILIPEPKLNKSPLPEDITERINVIHQLLSRTL